MDIQTAIREINKAAQSAKPGALIHYAATYANAMRGMEGYELHVQSLYVLNNLSAWRGETAREVKAFLKTL